METFWDYVWVGMDTHTGSKNSWIIIRGMRSKDSPELNGNQECCGCCPDGQMGCYFSEPFDNLSSTREFLLARLPNPLLLKATQKFHGPCSSVLGKS
jgi:hypothetical protein